MSRFRRTSWRALMTRRRDGSPPHRTSRNGSCSAWRSEPSPDSARWSSTRPSRCAPTSSWASWPATGCRHPSARATPRVRRPLARALPLVIGLGALLGGILVYLVAPETAGHGTDAAISAVHDHPRGVRFRAVVVKLVASALTIGSGGSGGREGPAAQISAGFGSLLSRLLDLEPADARVAVGAGIGSGIGSTFGAPLGGAVLASEILYRDDLDPAVLLPSFVASAVGYVVFGGIEGFTPLFGFTDYRFTDPIQLGWFALIGLLGGLIGLLYAKSFYGMERLFTRAPCRIGPTRPSAVCWWGAWLSPSRRCSAPDTAGCSRPRKPAHGYPSLGRADPARGPHRRHRTLHRLGGIGRTLRTGPGHRRLRRRHGLASLRPRGALHGPLPRPVRDRGHDVLLRGHLSSAAGRHGDGG